MTPEFNWRTVRQNVIDGLSPSQWFCGKVVLLVMVILPFIIIHVCVPGLLGFLRTDTGAAIRDLVPVSALAATCGLLLSCFTLGAAGAFLSVAIRNTAAAMGAFLLWGGLMEPVVIGVLVSRVLPRYAGYSEYLPWRTVSHLLEYRYYQSLGGSQGVARSQDGGDPSATTLDLTIHAVAAVVWMALFLGGAYACLRRRDL